MVSGTTHELQFDILTFQKLEAWVLYTFFFTSEIDGDKFLVMDFTRLVETQESAYFRVTVVT